MAREKGYLGLVAGGLVAITYELAALEGHRPVAVKVAQITTEYFCRIKCHTTIDIHDHWEHFVP